MHVIISVVYSDVVWIGTCVERIHVFWDGTPSVLVNNCGSFEGTAFEALVSWRIYCEDEGGYDPSEDR